MPPKIRCSKIQNRVLVEYMALHRNFTNRQFNGPLGANQYEAQWEALAKDLREYGPDKSVEAWKVTWRDLRRNARVKNADSNRARAKTGNNIEIPIAIEDQLVLAAIGHDSSEGVGPEESRVGDLMAYDLYGENWKEDLMTARLKAKQAESMSDVNDYDEVGKKRKSKKPVTVIESDASSDPEEDALDMFRIGNVTGTCQKKKNKLNAIPETDQNSEGIPCYNQFQSNKTPEKEVSLNLKSIDAQSTDHRSRMEFFRKDSTETEFTITPKSTGHQHKVMHLLTTLVEQNNQILNWIRSQNETDEIKRKKEPIKLPVQLPICDENELSTLEEYLNNDEHFGEMCNYLMSFCVNSPTSSVNQIMRHIISNELASKFSYRGKKGKRPFEQLNLKLVLIRTVKKYFKLSAETSIEDDMKVWLKHAPQRLKTSTMKKLNSSSNKDN